MTRRQNVEYVGTQIYKKDTNQVKQPDKAGIGLDSQPDKTSYAPGPQGSRGRSLQPFGAWSAERMKR